LSYFSFLIKDLLIMMISILKSVNDIDRTLWDSLLKHKIPFLDYDWIRIWCNNFVREQQSKIYLVSKKSGEVSGIIPLYEHQEKQLGIPFKGFSFTANSHSYRTQLIASPQDKGKVLNAWLDNIFKNERFDFIKFKEFLLDEEVLNHLENKKIKFSLEEEKRPPYIDLEGDWQNYFNSLRGHFRRNLRRRLRNAEKQFGKVEYRVFDGSKEQLEPFVLQGLELEASGWKGKQGSAILKNPNVKQLYLDIARVYFYKKQLHLGALYFGERMVAFNFSLIANQTFYLLKVAYDEEVPKFSPGQIMIFFLLQILFEQKIKRFDFLGPSMPWKLEWTQKYNQHFTLYIYGNNSKGQFLYLVNKKMLPALRKIKFLKKLKNAI